MYTQPASPVESSITRNFPFSMYARTPAGSMRSPSMKGCSTTNAALIKRTSGSTSAATASRMEKFFDSEPGHAEAGMRRFYQKAGTSSSTAHAERTRGELCACRSCVKPNLFLNRLADHGHDFVRDIQHVMSHGKVIRVLRYHFLVARSASLELAPGNEIIAIKDFHHNRPPKPNKTKNRLGWNHYRKLGVWGGLVNGTRPIFWPTAAEVGPKYR